MRAERSIFAEAPARRERQRHRDDLGEKAVAIKMLVVRMFRVKGEESNLMADGELFRMW